MQGMLAHIFLKKCAGKVETGTTTVTTIVIATL
jgi:hypothetical protein